MDFQNWLVTERYQTNVLEGIYCQPTTFLLKFAFLGLDPKSYLIHSRFITTFFGFVDDFYLQIVPTELPHINAVNIHSESRIGRSDFGMYLVPTRIHS